MNKEKITLVGFGLASIGLFGQYIYIYIVQVLNNEFSILFYGLNNVINFIIYIFQLFNICSVCI